LDFSARAFFESASGLLLTCRAVGGPPGPWPLDFDQLRTLFKENFGKELVIGTHDYWGRGAGWKWVRFVKKDFRVIDSMVIAESVCVGGDWGVGRFWAVSFWCSWANPPYNRPRACSASG
jgi:hypothetical protein